MKPHLVEVPAFGEAAREPGNKWAFWYRKPTPIPRDLTLTGRTVNALSEADASLGRLQGLGALIKDPELLLGPYLTQEAVASSRIEGTQASLSDVLRAEASGAPTESEDIQGGALHRRNPPWLRTNSSPTYRSHSGWYCDCITRCSRTCAATDRRSFPVAGSNHARARCLQTRSTRGSPLVLPRR